MELRSKELLTPAEVRAALAAYDAAQARREAQDKIGPARGVACGVSLALLPLCLLLAGLGAWRGW